VLCFVLESLCVLLEYIYISASVIYARIVLVGFKRVLARGSCHFESCVGRTLHCYLSQRISLNAGDLWNEMIFSRMLL